jgi:L-lactate dehydrogenase complex protein LldG
MLIENPMLLGGDVLQESEVVKLFRYKAEQVSAMVRDVNNFEEAIVYAMDICRQKQACTLLPSGCEFELSGKARDLCHDKPAKIIAATDLSQPHLEVLATHCDESGIRIITNGLRDYLGGVDIGLTWAQCGIAETGTLVIDSTNEDLRLATMVSEIHIAMLPVAEIYESAADYQDQLQAKMKNDSNYLAMITGASRTADIERVLTLGVHGPLELHIVLIKECHA